MTIQIFSTGGTIDKVYYDANSDYRIGTPQVVDILTESGVTVDYRIESLLKRDSLDMTAADRALIYEKVAAATHDEIVITHGTDSMLQTAAALLTIEGKTVVLTGAMQPARFRESDAAFNIGFALAAVQTLKAGVHVAMHGQIYAPQRARKNLEKGRFETID